jgi:regulator of sirC expression with transglutaminase-like and TPR domain
MAARPDAAVDLAEAALLIAGGEYPELDVDRYVARLDGLGAVLRERAGGAGVEAAVAALNHLLFEEEGFRGNTECYYDPRNSFLNDVLDRRTGIPISLSTVYMEVARRAGFAAEGLGLPGHFIVRVDSPTAPLLVDPFHAGARLTVEDCQRRLDRIYSGRLRLEPKMLEPCARKAILARMLRNLKGIYEKAGDFLRALRTVDMLLSLDPESGEDVRDRGLLLAGLDCYAAAATELERYVALRPQSSDAPRLGARIAELRALAARVN